ncbi:hypothetical protein JTB14_013750 [Gonioctena quinquepunctata]|nr:hypothetical protein JTB14_013750 [Gonioctena quinquepunctata]
MIWQYEKDLWKELTEECYHPTSEQGKYLNKYPNKYSRGEKILHKNFDIMKNSKVSDFEELIGGSYEGEQYILLKNLAFIERNKGPSDKNHEIASNIVNKEFSFRIKENRSLMRLITDVIEKNPGAIAETINPFYMEKLLEILDKMKELDPTNHALFIKNKPIPPPKVETGTRRTLPGGEELSPEWQEFVDLAKAEMLKTEKRDAVKKRERERMTELSRKHQSMEDPKNSQLLEKNKRKIEKLDENLPTEESEDEYDLSVEELDDMSSRVRLVIAGYKFRHIIGKDYDTPKYRFIKKEFMFFEPKKGEILMQKERMFLNDEEPSTESSDNNGDQDELEKEKPKKSDDKSTNEKDPIKANPEKEDFVPMEVDQGEGAGLVPRTNSMGAQPPPQINPLINTKNLRN